MRLLVFLSALTLLFLSACDAIQINVVPTTGDTAFDAAAAQNQLPNLSNYGYTSTSANSITDAIAAVGGSAALVTGDPVTAALVAKIDDMIQCYQGVGAVAANIYTDANLGQLVAGEIPKVGALAVINRDRLARNLLPCAVNTGPQGFSAQAVTIEPCAGSGTITRAGETLDYVYAATSPELCELFAVAMQ